MADENNVMNNAPEDNAESATDNLKSAAEPVNAAPSAAPAAASTDTPAAASQDTTPTAAPQNAGARPNPFDNMKNTGIPAMRYDSGEGARPNPFDNMQAQGNPYTQGNPYAQGSPYTQGNPYAQGNPYVNMQNAGAPQSAGMLQNGGMPNAGMQNLDAQGGMNPYFQGTPETPEGGKPAKKKMSKGKKIGIISGIVVFVAALAVCGLIFIPKLLKPKKETIKKAFTASQTSFVEGNTVAADFGLVEMGSNIKNSGGKIVVKAKNPKNPADKVDLDLNLDWANKEASAILDVSDNGKDATFRGYANKDKGYFTADDLMTGYYFVDFATIASDYVSSYFAEEYGSSYNFNNSLFDSFSSIGSVGAVSADQLQKLKDIFINLKDSIDYSKDGSKKLTLGGHSYDTTKYVLTISKKDLQNAVTDAFDILMSSAMGGSSNAEYYGAMLSSYISTIFSKDVKINLYVCDDRVVAMDAGYDIDVLGNRAGLSFEAQFEGEDDLFSALDASFKVTVDDRTMEFLLTYDSYETSNGSECVIGFKQIEDGDINQQIDYVVSYNRETSDIAITAKYPLSGDYFNAIYGKVLTLEKGKKIEIQFDTLADNSPYNYYGSTNQQDDINYTDIDVFVGLYSDFTIEKVPSDAKLVNFFTSSESEFKSIMSQKMQDDFEEWIHPTIYETDDQNLDYNERTTENDTVEDTTEASTEK